MSFYSDQVKEFDNGIRSFLNFKFDMNDNNVGSILEFKNSKIKLSYQGMPFDDTYGKPDSHFTKLQQERMFVILTLKYVPHSFEKVKFDGTSFDFTLVNTSENFNTTKDIGIYLDSSTFLGIPTKYESIEVTNVPSEYFVKITVKDKDSNTKETKISWTPGTEGSNGSFSDIEGSNGGASKANPFYIDNYNNDSSTGSGN